MSNVLFDRIVTLTVGETAKKGKLFDGFRINFSMEKDLKKDANTGKITIYNLNADSIGLIEKKDQIAILEVGYKGMPTVVESKNGPEKIYKPLTEILAIGNIKNVSTMVQGVDKLTSFEIGDGEDALTGSLSSKSYPPGTSAKSAVNDMIKDMGLIAGKITEIGKSVFENGLTVDGKTADRLGEVLDKVGKTYSVQDGEVQIIEKNGDVGQDAILITPDSGLVGSPSRKLLKKSDQNTVEGVELTMLLNPKIKPGRKIKVESRHLSGVFTVQKVSFAGDTNQGAFTCKLEAL